MESDSILSLFKTLSWFSTAHQITSPSWLCSHRPASWGPFSLVSCQDCHPCPRYSLPIPSALCPSYLRAFAQLVSSAWCTQPLATLLCLTFLHLFLCLNVPEHTALITRSWSFLPLKLRGGRFYTVWFTVTCPAQYLAWKRYRKYLLARQTDGGAILRDGEGVSPFLASCPVDQHLGQALPWSLHSGPWGCMAIWRAPGLQGMPETSEGSQRGN